MRIGFTFGLHPRLNVQQFDQGGVSLGEMSKTDYSGRIGVGIVISVAAQTLKYTIIVMTEQ